MMSFSRRALMRCAGWLALSGSTTVRANALGTERAADSSAAAERLLEVYHRPESAAQIGLAYLKAGPQTQSADEMVNAVVARLGVSPRLDAMTNAELKDGIALAVRDDFAAMRTIEVDGWILAETEVRLCALTALLGDVGQS